MAGRLAAAGQCAAGRAADPPGAIQAIRSHSPFPAPRPLSHPAKSELRRQLRRQRLLELPKVEAALQVQALRRLPPLVAADRWLGLYWPLAGEVDLRALASRLPGRVALPAVENGAVEGDAAENGAVEATAVEGGAERRLVYRPWRPGAPLVRDACGLPAPAPDGLPPLPASRMGLLLVPALALDGAGIRLGYGGGWFDRLRADPLWRAVPAVAVLPGRCRVASLPRDPWDVPFPFCLDEQGLHRLQDV